MMTKPGQVLVDFGHHGHRYSLLFTLPQQRQDIEREIRVAAKADLTGKAIGFTGGNHLPHHVHTLRHQVTNRMSVVGTHVVSLLVAIVQVTAGFEEKFRHPDIFGQAVFGDISGIGQLRNIAKQAPGKGPHETFFQGRTALRC